MKPKKIDARYPVFGAENYVYVLKNCRDVIHILKSYCLHLRSEVLSFAHAF
jgi:hypothetical protein